MPHGNSTGPPPAEPGRAAICTDPPGLPGASRIECGHDGGHDGHSGTTVFASPRPLWWTNHCTSSRNSAVLPVDHPGKEGMQIQGLPLLFPTLATLVPDGSFQLHTQRLGDTCRPSRPSVQWPCRETRRRQPAARSLISCHPLDPRNPLLSPPAAGSPAGERKSSTWRACRLLQSRPSQWLALEPRFPDSLCSHPTHKPRHRTTQRFPDFATHGSRTR